MADEFLIRHACLACSPPHLYICADCSKHIEGVTGCPDSRVPIKLKGGPVTVRSRRGSRDERRSNILRRLK